MCVGDVIAFIAHSASYNSFMFARHVTIGLQLAQVAALYISLPIISRWKPRTQMKLCFFKLSPTFSLTLMSLFPWFKSVTPRERNLIIEEESPHHTLSTDRHLLLLRKHVTMALDLWQANPLPGPSLYFRVKHRLISCHLRTRLVLALATLLLLTLMINSIRKHTL